MAKKGDSGTEPGPSPERLRASGDPSEAVDRLLGKREPSISLVLDRPNDAGHTPQILGFFDDAETARAEAEREWRERGLRRDEHLLLLLSTEQVRPALATYRGYWE